MIRSRREVEGDVVADSDEHGRGSPVQLDSFGDYRPHSYYLHDIALERLNAL